MRHLITLFLLALITASNCCIAQSSARHEWHFGAYAVRVREFGTSTALTISLGSDTLCYKGGADGMGYPIIDTITLNNDSLPDFAYSYPMEEYTVIGLLVSRPGKKHYQDVEITYVFDPTTYDSTIAKEAVIQTLFLRDINNDGRRDMLINSLAGENYKIPGWTLTLYNSQLRDIAAGRLKIDKKGRLFRPVGGLLLPK